MKKQPICFAAAPSRGTVLMMAGQRYVLQKVDPYPVFNFQNAYSAVFWPGGIVSC